MNNWRTKIKVYVECCICGERENVALYKTNLIRDIEKTSRLRSALVRINRLQIPVCHNCHGDIISGKYETEEVEFYNETIAKF